VVDFFSFDGEAQDRFKDASAIRRYQRPGDVPGDVPPTHRVTGTFNMGGMLEPDRMVPFDKLNRRLVSVLRHCPPSSVGVNMCAHEPASLVSEHTR
jgi:hypothetical protein